MSKIIPSGSYGLINNKLFTDVNFESCDWNAKIPQIEAERKLFRCSEVCFVPQGDIEISGNKHEIYRTTLEFKGEEYSITFFIEIKKGIVYVLRVDHEFFER